MGQMTRSSDRVYVSRAHLTSITGHNTEVF